MKAILTSIFFCALTTEAFACTCSFPQEVAEEYKERDLVIIGKVLSKQWVETEKSGFYLVEFEPKEVFKGELVNTNDTVLIQTGPRGPGCGFWFEEGKTYSVYANKENDSYTTSQCTRTTRSWRCERKKLKTLPNKT